MFWHWKPWNCDFVELWLWHSIQDSFFVPQIALTDSAESYVRQKGEAEQHSRVGDYERMLTLQEQGPT